MTVEQIAPCLPESRLLVVDDDPRVRSALTRLLKLSGYRVDEAESGRQALEMLERFHYDLMLLDIRMPGMDGVEVMRRARRLCSSLMIVVLTGHATLESAVTAVKAGAFDYLFKPSSNSEIGSVVARALRCRRRDMRRRRYLDAIVEAVGALQADDEQRWPPPADDSERIVRRGPVVLDREKCLAVVVEDGEAEGRSVRLTARETALLGYLMQHPETAFSCCELAQAALGCDMGEVEARRVVRPHISRLRKKLRAGSDIALIHTVNGRGYLFAFS